MLTESRFVKMPGQSKLGFRDKKSECSVCILNSKLPYTKFQFKFY